MDEITGHYGYYPTEKKKEKKLEVEKQRLSTRDRHMTHLNNNVLCALSILTTGKIASIHDIIQISVVALDSELNLSKHIMPFSANIRPKRPLNLDKNYSQLGKENYNKIVESGLDANDAADSFDKWFEDLDLAFRKKIALLVEDWGFVKPFLVDWLGYETFTQFFDNRVRDTTTIALYLNDRSDQAGESAPFPKVHLRYLSSQLKIENVRRKDTMEDIILLIEIYKRLLKYKTFN